MQDVGLMAPVKLPKGFTDVLYLSNQKRMPYELKRLFKHRKLSYVMLPLDKFPQIAYQLDLIGTVVIYGEGLDISQQQKIAQIIESLELKNIGVILLSERVAHPIKSFSLTGPPVKSFSLTTAMKTYSTDELWTRISVNLAYRKKSSSLIIKPAVPPKQIEITHGNKLAEQLRMTGSLVDSLAEQLRMAGLVQRDFLPSQLPNTDKVRWAANFLPAEWVSGDIYDVVRIDEEHIGFYVADAVGHSMPAALLTIFLKQAIVMRETIDNEYHIFSPVEVMKNLNMRIAMQKLSGYQFATCCYCILNTKTLELNFARAGHPYPILLRPEQRPQQLEVRGSLLGIFEEAEYVEQTVQLQPGDKVLLYSDGLEPFIGTFDDLTGFHFSKEFYKIKGRPLGEMFDKLNTLIHSKKINPTGVDDITAVGLEIL